MMGSSWTGPDLRHWLPDTSCCFRTNIGRFGRASSLANCERSILREILTTLKIRLNRLLKMAKTEETNAAQISTMATMTKR
jgi:hypothetical protein